MYVQSMQKYIMVHVQTNRYIRFTCCTVSCVMTSERNKSTWTLRHTLVSGEVIQLRFVLTF